MAMFRSLAFTWYGVIASAAALHGCVGQASTDSGVPDSACTPSTFYADADGDGYGDSGASSSACSPPPGVVANGEDCDDADAGILPGGVEICGDGEDQDCDGIDVECARVVVLSMPNYLVGATESEGIGDAIAAVNDGSAIAVSGDYLRLWAGPVDGEQRIDAAPLAWESGYAIAAVGPPNTMAVRNYDALVLYDERSEEPYLSDTFRGNGSFANSGSSVAPTTLEVGDLTGEGIPDLAYSWHWPDNENPDHSAQTLLVVSSDRTGDLGDGDEAVRIDGVGRSLAIVGDTDGDGVDDLLASSGYDHEWYLFRGPLAGTVPSDAADVVARLDDAVVAEAIGDADGDGLGDVAFTISNVDAPTPIYGLVGSNPFGNPVAEFNSYSLPIWGGFDVNGDGWNDVILSWLEWESSSERTTGVWLVPGPFAGVMDVENDGRMLLTGANSAQSVAATDLDGDGAMEMAIGLPCFAEEALGANADCRGAVFILSQDQMDL